MDREFINKIGNLYKENDKLPKQCLYENCNKIAIKSHILQSKGILNQLTDGSDNHLIQFRQNNIYELIKTNDKFKFEKVGIGKALTFDLFCSEHDNKLFEHIEKTIPNFYDYKTQILFTYRALCAELRRKKTIIKIESTIIAQTKNHKMWRAFKTELNPHIIGLSQGVKDITYYQKVIETELNTKSDENFIFRTFEYNNLQVCCSAMFTPTNQLNENINNPEIPWEAIFINLIPNEGKLIVIVGYHKNHTNQWISEYIKTWDTNDSMIQQKNISELFTCRLETWAMSIDMFNQIPENLKSQFLEFYEENSLSHDESLHFGVNLFENYNPKN